MSLRRRRTQNIGNVPYFELSGSTSAAAIHHLGVEVDSSDEVHDEIARFAGDGLVTEERMGNNCCFATQDKVWVSGPAGERWEIYTVLADSETIGNS